MESENYKNIQKINFKKKNKIYLLIINSFVILFIRLSKIIEIKQIFYNKNALNRNNSRDLNKQNARIKALKIGIKYLRKCLKGFLINNFNKYSNYNKPIITAIIPVYNCEKTIKASLRSIQNQNFLNIEIILVNDYSKDNSSKVIEQFKREDLRIKIINNNNNMGTLYSRCIGTLLSKGEYIFNLDNDDMIFDENVLEFIYKNAKNGNLDIVAFKSIFSKGFYNFKEEQMIDNPLPKYSYEIKIYQPQLRNSLISKFGKFKDVNIWGKIIKNKIYKKGINYLGIKRYSIFMSWAEDTCMCFIIYNIAQSYKFIIFQLLNILERKWDITYQFRKIREKKKLINME